MNDEERAIAALKEIADRCEVFGFEFESGNGAYAIWKLNSDLTQRLMKPRKGQDVTAGASLWRAQDPFNEKRWYVLVCDDGLHLRERGQWGAGRPYEIDAGLHRTLVERHLHQLIATHDAGGEHIGHYGLGAEIGPGGELRIRIGGDE